MRCHMTRYAAAGLALLLLAGLPGAALGASPGASATAGSAFPIPVYGPAEAENAAQPAISRDEALALLQRYFKLPEGPGRLELELVPYPTGRVWELVYWIDQGRGGYGVGIGEVDALTGRIRSVDFSDCRPLRKGPLGEPRSEDEARSRAWELIRALYPDKADSLQFDDSVPMFRPSNPWDTYTFSWTEHRSGIPVAPNTVVVSVDRYTLDYVFFRAQFDTDLVIPEAEAVVTKEEALAAFQEAAKPTLRYQVIYPTASSQFDAEPDVKLLYEVEVPAILDAVSGEFIEVYGTAAPQGEPKEVPGGGEPLKPASLPVTKETAEAFSREVLELPTDSEDWSRGMSDVNAGESVLQAYWMWSEGDAWVEIDRETGRVKGAYRNFTDSDSDEEALEPTPEQKEAAEQEAIRVVQRLYGDLLPDLRMEPVVWRRYYYGGQLTIRFQRYVNGIPYAHDGVDVNVDYRTGQWSSISFEWTDEVDAPAPDGIISPEEAIQAYFKDRVPVLVYYPKGGLISVLSPTEEPVELALVYGLRAPEEALRAYGIDPFTGEPMTAGIDDAEVVDSQIAGHWAEGEIRFLLGRNLVDANALNPERPVTRAEALNLLIRLYEEYTHSWLWRDVVIPYTDVPKEGGLTNLVHDGLAIGILQPEGPEPVFGADEAISRADFVLWLVRALDLDRLADSGLKTASGFTDAAELSPAVRNAAAILAALGIIPASGELRGDEPLTLGEAAAALVRFVEYLQEVR